MQEDQFHTLHTHAHTQINLCHWKYSGHEQIKADILGPTHGNRINSQLEKNRSRNSQTERTHAARHSQERPLLEQGTADLDQGGNMRGRAGRNLNTRTLMPKLDHLIQSNICWVAEGGFDSGLSPLSGSGFLYQHLQLCPQGISSHPEGWALGKNTHTDQGLLTAREENARWHLGISGWLIGSWAIE